MNEIRFRRTVLRWFGKHRRDLPWRRTSDPYKIFVSEVMLQQTQVERVIPKFREFLSRFPGWRQLAKARLGGVLRVWSGLGYNNRARRLWETARVVRRDFGGEPPGDVQTLARLPGVGQYTACAVASIAFGARCPAIDTNARRVLSRVFGGKDALPQPAVERFALAVLPRSRAGEWNQALMDIGAIYCRSTPRCAECPVRRICRWAIASGGDLRSPRHRPSVERYKAGHRPSVERYEAGHRPSVERFEGSRRYYRGRIVQALSHNPRLSFLALGPKIKEDFRESDFAWLLDLLRALAHDGLVILDERRNRARLP